MANVFATFVVAPVLIFGVDRAVQRIGREQQRVRHEALIAELRDAASRAVNVGATGTIPNLLPGLLDEMFARAAADGIQALTRLTSERVLARRTELRTAIAGLAVLDLARLTARVAEERSDVGDLVAQVGQFLPAELHARLFKASRRLREMARTHDLLDYGLKNHYDLNTPNGVAMRAVIAKDVTSALCDLASAVLATDDYHRAHLTQR